MTPDAVTHASWEVDLLHVEDTDRAWTEHILTRAAGLTPEAAHLACTIAGRDGADPLPTDGSSDHARLLATVLALHHIPVRLRIRRDGP